MRFNNATLVFVNLKENVLKITSTNFSVRFEQNDNGKIGKTSNMAFRFHLNKLWYFVSLKD